ncbi:MAG: phage tail protein [Desulfobulbus sp.]
MFLTLGDIGFGLLTSPRGFETRMGTCYAELQVIEGKPLLQYTGDNLDGHLLTFTFRSDFCDPQEVWDALKNRQEGHQPLALFLGNGTVLGNFVIARLDRSILQAADDGTLLAFEATLDLKEYVDPQPLVTRKAQKRAQAPARKKPGKRAKAATEKKDLPAIDVQPVACHPQTFPAEKLEVTTVASHATRQPVATAEKSEGEPWLWVDD